MKGENKLDISKIAKSMWTVTKKHSPEILTGVGIAGMITTTVMAVRATPKALILIENKKREKQVDELKPIDVVKSAWKPYIPAVVTGTTSIMCLVGASSVNVRRNAALATAYAISESSFREYREKVIETIGEKKEQVVRDEVAKDKIQSHPVTNREVIITERGNTLCYDAISGRYFKSDIDKLRKAENELNRRMIGEMYVSLNEFYSEIGLSSTSIGDDLGWNINNGYIELSFSSQLAENGEPCLVIDYYIAPKYDFSKS